MKIEIADDLLDLQIEANNLQLDSSDHNNPKLVIENSRNYLVYVVGSQGRTELWHTRLVLKVPTSHENPDSITELSHNNPAPLRAIWSPDYNPISPPRPANANYPRTMDPNLWLLPRGSSPKRSIIGSLSKILIV